MTWGPMSGVSRAGEGRGEETRPVGRWFCSSIKFLEGVLVGPARPWGEPDARGTVWGFLEKRPIESPPSFCAQPAFVKLKTSLRNRNASGGGRWQNQCHLWGSGR